MKTKSLLASIILPLTLTMGTASFSTLALADDHKDRCSGKHHKKGGHKSILNSERMQKKLMKKLDLTDAQEVTLQGIMTKYAVDNSQHCEQRQEMLNILATLEPGTGAYNDQIDLITSTEASNRATMMKAWGNAQAEINLMLTTEQQEEFDELLKRMNKRRGKHH